MKLAFIFLAITLVFGVQAENDVQPLEYNPEAMALINTIKEVQRKVTEIVETAINKFKETYAAAKEKALEISKELSDHTKEIIDRISQNGRAIMASLEERFNDLWERVKQFDISQCKAVGTTLLNLGKDSLTNMGSCFGNTMELGTEYLKNIFGTSADIPSSVAEFTDQARICFEGKKQYFKSDAESIISCIQDFGSSVYNKTTESITDMTANVIKLSGLMKKAAGDFNSQLPKCLASQGLHTFLNNTHLIYSEVETCVKINIAKIKGEHLDIQNLIAYKV